MAIISRPDKPVAEPSIYTVIIDWVQPNGSTKTMRYGFDSRREARDFYNGAKGAERVEYCALCQGPHSLLKWWRNDD